MIWPRSHTNLLHLPVSGCLVVAGAKRVFRQSLAGAEPLALCAVCHGERGSTLGLAMAGRGAGALALEGLALEGGVEGPSSMPIGVCASPEAAKHSRALFAKSLAGTMEGNVLRTQEGDAYRCVCAFRMHVCVAPWPMRFVADSQACRNCLSSHPKEQSCTCLALRASAAIAMDALSLATVLGIGGVVGRGGMHISSFGCEYQFPLKWRPRIRQSMLVVSVVSPSGLWWSLRPMARRPPPERASLPE